MRVSDEITSDVKEYSMLPPPVGLWGLYAEGKKRFVVPIIGISVLTTYVFERDDVRNVYSYVGGLNNEMLDKSDYEGLIIEVGSKQEMFESHMAFTQAQKDLELIKNEYKN